MAISGFHCSVGYMNGPEVDEVQALKMQQGLKVGRLCESKAAGCHCCVSDGSPSGKVPLAGTLF